MQQSIGFIGSGHMTGAIVGGLVADSANQHSIMISNRSRDKLVALCEKYAVKPADSNQQVVANCETVVLAVKPQLLEQVVQPLATLFQEKMPLVISVAAGVRSHALTAWIGADLPLIRAMPNMPSVIREGATGLFATHNVSQKQKDVAENIFNSIGLASWLTDENDIDKVTAVSGSGPAYFMLMIQSLIDAAVEAGMAPESAKQLAVQTARGTAGMISQSDKPLEQLIDDMLLPGGTTEQAVAALRQNGLPAALKAAFDAANLRAQQLATELSR